MNRQLKAKLKYQFFHFPFASPDTFTFEKTVYRIIDKKKLKKVGNPLSGIFLCIMSPIMLGASVFKNIFYILMILLVIGFIAYDWIRLPKDIFPYLEKKGQ